MDIVILKIFMKIFIFNIQYLKKRKKIYYKFVNDFLPLILTVLEQKDMCTSFSESTMSSKWIPIEVEDTGLSSSQSNIRVPTSNEKSLDSGQPVKRINFKFLIHSYMFLYKLMKENVVKTKILHI